MSDKCERCNGTGTIGIRTRYPLSYVGPGPVPEDAREIAESLCDECGGKGTVQMDDPAHITLELGKIRNRERDAAIRAAVEAMRARCEAIAWNEHQNTRLPCSLVARRIADAIAILKSDHC